MRKIVFAFIGLFLVLPAFNSYASLIINPSDDGYITDSDAVVTTTYVVPTASSRGIIEFPLSSITGQIGEAILSISPYGLPLYDTTVGLYGYESNDGILTVADYSAGQSLGIWTLSSSLDFGEDAFFDVTSFLQTVSSSYVGFNLRTSATDVFSSLEYHDSWHPSQLAVTVVPEPSSLILLTLGMLGTGLFKRKITKK